MSFIYEKDLVNKLIKAAQTDPSTTNTNPIMNNPNMAVAVPGNAPNKPDPNIEIAKKLLQNVKKEMDGGFSFKSEKEDAGVYPRDLVDLDALFHFLVFNKIRANDMLIAVPYDKQLAKMKEVQDLTGEVKPMYDSIKNDEYNRLNETEKKEYVPYPNANNPSYFIYKNGLIAYLRDLQSKNIQILNPYLTKLIDQTNTQLQFGMPYVAEKPKTTPTTDKSQQGKGDGSVQQVSYQQQTGGRPAKSKTLDLNKLLGKLPLFIDKIDFGRIEEFVNTYTRMTGKYPAYVNNIRRDLRQIHGYHGVGITQPLNSLSKDTVVIKKGTAREYFALLKDLILNVYSLISDLKSSIEDYMDDQLKSEFDRQIGTGPNDATGLATQNIDLLTTLEEKARV